MGDAVILALSLAAIDCHSLGIYTAILLSFPVEMTVPPRASVTVSPSAPSDHERIVCQGVGRLHARENETVDSGSRHVDVVENANGSADCEPGRGPRSCATRGPRCRRTG